METSLTGLKTRSKEMEPSGRTLFPCFDFGQVPVLNLDTGTVCGSEPRGLTASNKLDEKRDLVFMEGGTKAGTGGG